MIKLAMIGIDQAMRGQGSEVRSRRSEVGSKMLLQVHDELVFEVPMVEVEMMKKIVVENMKHALKLDVPIEVEVGTGRNWLEAH
jgi:DNA polymerase-1